MRVARLGIALALVFFCTCADAFSQEQKMTVTGKLTRMMAIGGESTGWAIQLDSQLDVDGKQVDTLEVASKGIGKFETLQNKHVRATGKLSYRNGVETGRRSVLEISSIKEVKAKPGQASQGGSTAALDLIGSEWLLEDLGGSGALDRVQATLAFPARGKVAGKSSCNRFMGPAEIDGNSIKLGPLAGTRMACPEAVMNQETKYLNALGAAERFEWKDPYLLLYCKGFEKPLRFTRKEASNPAAQE